MASCARPISTEFRETWVLEIFPKGGMIHLCGSHHQHIDTWVNMDKMRVFQLIRTELEEYFAKMRKDQLLYFFPADEKKNVYPSREFIEQAMDITGGNRMVIMAAVPPVKKK